MAKRYLGGGISFEQKDVYQEFSEEESPSPGGSSTLAGLTDVDISNPSDGQTLVYDATSEKWVNGSGGSGGGFTLLHGVYSVDGNDDAIITLPITAAELYALMQTSFVSFVYSIDYSAESSRDIIVSLTSSDFRTDLEYGDDYHFHAGTGDETDWLLPADTVVFSSGR